VLIRAGIIGSSGVGRLHVDALRRIGIEIAGIAAATRQIAEGDAARLGVSEIFASAEELIASDAVDVVHVCTPNVLHFPLCRAALYAGKHVVAEKPLCTSLADAEMLLRLAEERGLIHALCHGYRYYPMIQALRELISRGQLGQVKAVSGVWLCDELLAIDASHWMLDPQQMGPSLTLADVGVHWWDLVEHVTGTPMVEVMCETHAMRPAASAGEDTAILIARLDGGAMASATICQVAPGHGNTLAVEVVGEHASAAWDIRRAQILTVRELGGGGKVLERASSGAAEIGVEAFLPRGQPEGHSEALRALFDRVYDRIGGHGTRRDHPTFADGVRGLRVLDAALRSAASRAWAPVG
jgi:predicted dehydrogenase